MRIFLLTDDDIDAPEPRDPDDPPCDPRPFLPEAEWELAVLEKETAVSRVIELTGRDFDVFFNLCDGAWDEDRPGIEVVRTLETRGAAFTGATSEFYEPSREVMKRVCAAWGIPYPGYVAARDLGDAERALDLLRFPMIVKHPSSYASVGLTPDSRVESAGALREQAERMIGAYGGALIEEFIEGREFTVLVAENPHDPRAPSTYKPIEFRFPDGETFKHERIKWVDYHDMEDVPCDDPELEALLRDVSARFFLGLNGAGYGRCDLRVDGEGRPYMLEINANPGVFYPPSDPGSADLCLLHDAAGHEGFIRQVVDAALTRRERRRRAWLVRSNGNGDYGLYAARRIRAGERIVGWEESPHTLVTLSHVEEHWDEPRSSWFDRYAWPLTEEVWVTWSRDPEEWRPLNHSCDPSAWLDGLDVVARRELAPGEEITLDYATFCNDRMPDFECRCGTDACRATVRGSDHLEPFVARYEGHVSDYVRRKREERGLPS